MRDNVRDLFLGALELIALTVIAVTHALPGEAVASLFSLSIGIRALQARNAGAGSGGAGGSIVAAGSIASAGLLGLALAKGAQFLHLRSLRSLAVSAACFSFAITGCTGWLPQPATIAADVTNRAIPALVALEQAQGDAVLARGEGTSAVEAAWAPVWAALSRWATAQDAWATAVERGDSGVEQLASAALATLCEVQSALPAGAPPELLTVEGFLCPLTK